MKDKLEELIKKWRSCCEVAKVINPPGDVGWAVYYNCANELEEVLNEPPLIITAEVDLNKAL